MSGSSHGDDIVSSGGLHVHFEEDSPSSDTTREEDSPISDTTRESSTAQPNSRPCPPSTSSSTHGHEKVQPSQTSSWLKGHLVDLKLRVSSLSELSKSPLDFVNMLGVGLSPSDEHRVKMLSKQIQKMTLFLYVLDKVFDNMSLTDAMHLSTHSNLWKINGMDSKDEEQFNIRFRVSGHSFAMWLRHCLYLRDVTREPVSEFMYQHLFVLFLQLFGVKCIFAPGIPKRTMMIRNQKISGSPDIIANWYSHQNVSLECKTLFVCQVKKTFDRTDEPQQKTPRLASPLARSDPPMPDELLGQHGAELLMYFPTSLAKNVVIGMIIEKTYVSFTALSCTSSQYIDILSGSLKSDRENGPKLIYTRPYNYLVKEDRDHLVEPFLRLGFLQELGENNLRENFNP